MLQGLMGLGMVALGALGVSKTYTIRGWMGGSHPMDPPQTYRGTAHSLEDGTRKLRELRRRWPDATFTLYDPDGNYVS
jgi:LmbE family N-acetylglucosaminyl deacetylase